METALPLAFRKVSQKLYTGNAGCLHSVRYILQDRLLQPICGACFFREGYISELPARMTYREYSGLFGSPQMHQSLQKHIQVSEGLLPPRPEESLARYRKRRARTNPSLPDQFPYLSALWELMGYQPPLAKVLIPFVQGRSEAEIAELMNISLFNVVERMGKAVHVGKRFLQA